MERILIQCNPNSPFNVLSRILVTVRESDREYWKDFLNDPSIRPLLEYERNNPYILEQITDDPYFNTL